MTIRSALVCLFVGLIASGCGSGTSGPLSAADFGNKYKLSANDVPGWTPTVASTDDPSPFNIYNGSDELVGRLDGGDIYSVNGCRVSMYQDLTGPSQAICTVVAMDFVTTANATKMFTYQQENGYALSIPGYDASTALGSSTLGGINAVAHFGASYFEVQLSGFADATSAGTAAKPFLDVFKSKTN